MAYKKISLLVFAFFALAFLPQHAFSQNNVVKKAADQLDKWVGKSPQEKVYLHFDKPYYAIGDDIWFKAYVVIGPKHELSGLSGTLNVELIENSADTILQSVKLRIINGVAKGDFFLADTLNAGAYRVRAYTNWMRNASSDYFFDKTIAVGKSIILKNTNKSKIARNVAGKKTKAGPGQIMPGASIQFFPEGGNLVNGVWSKIGFKAVGADGYGKDVSCTITDNSNTEITTFKSRHLGMGAFAMMPQIDKVYTAHVKYADGLQADVPLPKANDNGYVLTVANTSDYVTVRVAANPSADYKNAGPVNLIVHCGGAVCFAAEYNFESSIAVSKIPKSRFISGVTQFTLFGKTGQPLNERIIFIDNPDQTKLTIIPQGSGNGVGQKIKLGIGSQSPGGSPVVGTYSAAVINESKVPFNEDNEHTILSELLLKLDLKGFIEKPNYYFTNPNDSTRADLDVLMLTQGYRRFEWKKLIDDAVPPPIFKPENALSVSGNTQTLNDKPLAGAKVSLYTKSKGMLALDTVSDQKGNFIFDNMEFPDSLRFIIQARNAKDKKYVQIKVNDLTGPPLFPEANIPEHNISYNDLMLPYLQNSLLLYDTELRNGVGRHTTILKEVNIKAKQYKLDRSVNLNGNGNADQVIPGSAFDGFGCGNIIDCLQGKVLGVKFGNGMAYNLKGKSITAGAGGSASEDAMQINIDGLLVGTDGLQFVDAANVESIEILRSNFYLLLYGSEAAAGMIIIHTKQAANPKNYKPYSPWIISYKPKGYYAARTFYSPQYDDPKTDKTTADLRSTIYWNPNIITGKDGAATIEYYNAAAGRYKVIVEGIDADGHIGRKVFSYNVQ